MIDALLTGTLHAKPEQRTSKNGKPYVVAKLLVAVGEERVFASCIAFDAAACRALLTLDAGESTAIAGELRPKVFNAKDGTAKVSLDCTAHAVLTAYHVRRKHQAVEEGTP